MDIIAQVVAEAPRFHCAGETTWAVNENVLREMQRHIHRKSRTLETGCGLSTVLFAILECDHVCVTPSQDEADRVEAYCRQIGHPAGRVRFLIGSSDRVLPRLVEDGPLDFVLIDGAHRFPYPALDFHYVEHRLRVKGWLVVDDIHIRSVTMLNEFLCAEREWKLTCLLQQTAFYRKVGQPLRTRDWCDQRINDIPAAVPRTTLSRRALAKARRVLGRWL